MHITRKSRTFQTTLYLGVAIAALSGCGQAKPDPDAANAAEGMKFEVEELQQRPGLAATPAAVDLSLHVGSSGSKLHVAYEDVVHEMNKEHVAGVHVSDNNGTALLEGDSAAANRVVTIIRSVEKRDNVSFSLSITRPESSPRAPAQHHFKDTPPAKIVRLGSYLIPLLPKWSATVHGSILDCKREGAPGMSMQIRQISNTGMSFLDFDKSALAAQWMAGHSGRPVQDRSPFTHTPWSLYLWPDSPAKNGTSQSRVCWVDFFVFSILQAEVHMPTPKSDLEREIRKEPSTIVMKIKDVRDPPPKAPTRESKSPMRPS